MLRWSEHADITGSHKNYAYVDSAAILQEAHLFCEMFPCEREICVYLCFFSIPQVHNKSGKNINHAIAITSSSSIALKEQTNR
jgi:hypothetical protein